MKTAVSIPDDVFLEADALAEELGLSRSRLYSLAVAEYLARHRDADITDRLNEVYAKEDGALDERLRSAQARSVESPGW